MCQLLTHSRGLEAGPGLGPRGWALGAWRPRQCANAAETPAGSGSGLQAPGLSARLQQVSRQRCRPKSIRPQGGRVEPPPDRQNPEPMRPTSSVSNTKRKRPSRSARSSRAAARAERPGRHCRTAGSDVVHSPLRYGSRDRLPRSSRRSTPDTDDTGCAVWRRLCDSIVAVDYI